MSRPLRDDDFKIALTLGEMFIGIFYNIFRGNSNRNLQFPRINIILNHLWQKRDEKMINLSKIVFLDDETTFRHIFPSSNLPCLPQGDLRKFCVNEGSGYRQLIQL